MYLCWLKRWLAVIDLRDELHGRRWIVAFVGLLPFVVLLQLAAVLGLEQLAAVLDCASRLQKWSSLQLVGLCEKRNDPT